MAYDAGRGRMQQRFRRDASDVGAIAADAVGHSGANPDYVHETCRQLGRIKEHDPFLEAVRRGLEIELPAAAMAAGD